MYAEKISLRGFRLHLNHVKGQVSDIFMSKVDESQKRFIELPSGRM